MDALIITAPGIMTNPGPVLPDIDTGLYFDVRASDYTWSDGATITPFTTQRGNAPVTQRTWQQDGQNGTGWTLPKFATDGRGDRYFAFNGTTNAIKNISAFGTPLTVTDYTWYFVLKNANHPASNAPFLMSVISDNSYGLTAWMDSASGHNRAYIGYTGAVALSCPTLDADDWTVVVIAQTATQTRVKIGNSDITTFTQNKCAYKGQLIGQNWVNASTPPGTLNGGLKRWGMFSRSLGDDDLNGLYTDLCLTYGIVP